MLIGGLLSGSHKDAGMLGYKLQITLWERALGLIAKGGLEKNQFARSCVKWRISLSLAGQQLLSWLCSSGGAQHRGSRSELYIFISQVCTCLIACGILRAVTENERSRPFRVSYENALVFFFRALNNKLSL